MSQQRLIETPDAEDTRIETDGRRIRPALSIPDALVDEAKVHLNADYVTIRAVDPANVGMFDVDIYPAAFDAYEHAGEHVTIGTNLDLLTSQLSSARMGKRSADAVALTVSPGRTVIDIERGYGETTVTRRSELLNLDPDSIREEPDLPDLQLDYEATVDAQAFKDVVEHVNRAHDHVSLIEGDGHLHVGGSKKADSDEGAVVTGSEATFEDAASALHDGATAGATSLFSMDYMLDMARGLKAAKVDHVTVEWGDEFPCRLRFERWDADDKCLYDGLYLLAPRIQSD